ncbi:hypothetical protein ASPVEDRAFT_42938 [Aspergillus versicolor CBS 583.65]|uniref:MARVEL domain-containing protein n=1 Tax=Aspergillus versicolor CBS 583.65 TaxID=1036611 RepID=A0A1L9PPN5_ASPVE|nr:uncharacterized protein ASPVEDRAFT_42938 [Aspergillus versicolor CBS 583.65]OJJ03480.1 hypothetical protein ASPVEDRAFT_42938 [Aspergillus versicolor CBS 583.65]
MGPEKLILTYESALVIVCLVLALHAYPDTCRTILWQYGGSEGWNSNPQDRIYFYANYRDPPPIPKIWSEEITESNLAISAVSTVTWIIRVVLLRYQPGSSRWILAAFDMLLVALWAISVHAQLSSDLSDAEHPSAWPWYLVHACGGLDHQERGCCTLARWFLAASSNTLALYMGRFGWCVLSLFRGNEAEVAKPPLAFRRVE